MIPPEDLLNARSSNRPPVNKKNARQFALVAIRELDFCFSQDNGVWQDLALPRVCSSMYLFGDRRKARTSEGETHFFESTLRRVFSDGFSLGWPALRLTWASAEAAVGVATWGGAAHEMGFHRKINTLLSRSANRELVSNFSHISIATLLGTSSGYVQTGLAEECNIRSSFASIAYLSGHFFFGRVG